MNKSDHISAAGDAFQDSMDRLQQQELILNPARWPRFPVLCLRHRTNQEQGLPQIADVRPPGYRHHGVSRAAVFAGRFWRPHRLRSGPVRHGKYHLPTLAELLSNWMID